MRRDRRTKVWLLAVTAAACLVHASRSTHAQETRPTFKTGVALVPITAVVRDTRNRIVRDLTPDDFQVFENSHPRPIVDFRAMENAPISVALLLDTSGSMRGANFENARQVVERLLDAMNQTSDEVALFTFDKGVRQETPFTRDPEIVRCALDQTEAWGLTSLYDAIAETSKHLGDRRAQRRAVVVITDGTDTSSERSAPEVSGLASSIDVPVYVVTVVPPPNVHRKENGNADLSNLAYWTGGHLHHATSSEQADRVIGALLAELRHQYLLAIESSNTSGWYRLDVRTRRKNLTVRTRSGYFATTGPRTGAGG